MEGYRSFTSRPAPGTRQKQNAQIMVAGQQVKVIQRKCETDYISVVATGVPFAGPTLIICMYLNKFGPAGATTRQETTQTAEEDIWEFLESSGSSGNVIVGGDLNCTIDEMEEEAVNGSWLFEYLITLHRSRNTTTSYHNGGTR